MRLYVSLLMFLSLSQLVEARLGKTKDECDALYGASLLTKTRTDGTILIRNYGNESVVISCRFYNDVCFELGVSSLDELGQIKSLSPERVAGLFLKNFGNIPKVNPQAKNIGANTVEHALGSDGRYVWREEQTTTGVITVLRDNTLAPSVTTNSKKSILLPQETDADFLTITKNDTLELSRLRLSGKPSSVYVKSTAKNNFESWKKASESGAAEGQYLYGLCLSFGCMVSSNETAAVSWFRKAAEQGYAPAQYSLAVCFANGLGVSKNEIEAFNLWRKSSEQGYALAQSRIGTCFAHGQGVVKDTAEALKWWRKAAEQNHMKSQILLGIEYSDGAIVKKNDTEAVSWFRKAATLGDPAAQYFLGGHYFRGEGVSQNDAEAVSWYRKSAEQGDVQSQVELGFCYEQGRGIDKDPYEAIKWYQLAAENGVDRAQIALANLYLREENVSPQNVCTAAKWYRMAAARNAPEAQYSLAELYREGRGVTQNTTEAINLYKKAADQGYVLAMSELSDIYASGSIAPKNPSEAFKWCRDAALAGSLDYQFYLAIMYAKGYATVQDYSQSCSWLLKCAENHETEAIKEMQIFKNMSYLLLSEYHKKGLGVAADESTANYWRSKVSLDNANFTFLFLGSFFQSSKYPKPDYKEAFKWFLLGATNNDPLCQCYVGLMYEIGCGTEIDLTEASKWVTKAKAGGVNVDRQRKFIQESLSNASK